MQATYSNTCALVVLNMLLPGQTHINYMITSSYTLQSVLLSLNTGVARVPPQLWQDMHATYAMYSSHEAKKTAHVNTESTAFNLQAISGLHSPFQAKLYGVSACLWCINSGEWQEPQIRIYAFC